ncbi:MAG TPA: hypothetical protein VMW31_03800, partial [Devosiaceae bacterium]|nr:hypothetical protein [Devosiaceae bacterium]
MIIPNLVRLAGMVTMTAGLAACIDVSMDISVLSDSTARGTMSASIDASMYQMLVAQEGQSDFCEDGEVTVGEVQVT